MAEKMTEFQLKKAEEAIEMLSDALDVYESKIVEYLEHGFEMTSPNCKLTENQKYFLDEMKATFGY